MKILIVSINQFGYLVDYHRYYDYLTANGHTVTFLCWDFEKSRLDGGDPNIIYVSRTGGKAERVKRLIDRAGTLEKANKFDRVLVNWFKFATALLLAIPRRKLYLDIRTVSVDTSAVKRKLFDSMMLIDSKLFKRVSVISDLSAAKLKIKKYSLLPLGGTYFSDHPSQPEDRQYENLLTGGQYDFLYVGTLHLRRIIDCVRGFHAYIQKHPQVNTRFIIIGDAIHQELREIRDYVARYSLADKIITLGYLPQTRLPVFFEHVFCGVSYVPITVSFNVQPSTKTYEYLINGIPVIATSIQDNIRVIDSSPVPCGMLIKDNAADFERAVAYMIDQAAVFDRQAISRQFSRYRWDNLFQKYLNSALDLSDTQMPVPA